MPVGRYNSRMIRICVIGAGSHSRGNHGPSLRDLQAERPEVVSARGVCDLDEGRARQYAADFGFHSAYSDYRQMIERERPDALVLVSPIDLTVRLVEEIAAYGLPLLLEKPPGRTVTETEYLIGVVSEAGIPHMVSFNRRFNPALIAARRWLEMNSDREPQFIDGRMLRTRRLEPDFIMGTGIHLTDTMMSLLGRCDQAESRRWTTASGGQCGSCRVSNSSGPDGTLLILPDTGSIEETYELYGSGYYVYVSTEPTLVRVVENGKTVLEQRFDDQPAHVSGGAMNETKAFVNAITGGSAFSPTLTEALEAMRLADAIERGVRR